MKQHYTLTDGQATEIEVNTAVAQLLASFEREDKNEARNKRRRKEVSIEAMHEETGWEPTDHTVNIEVDYIVKEEKGSLLSAVAQLSEKQQRLIRFYYYEEKTTYEIATILGINQSNVHRQLVTIHNTLKKYFEKLL